MDLEHWRTPPQLDMQPFELVEHDQRRAAFRQPMQLMNYQGQVFEMLVDRVVKIHDDASTAEFLGMPLPPGVFSVCHESQNSVTNVGDTDWQADFRRQTSTPCRYVLCVYESSGRCFLVVRSGCLTLLTVSVGRYTRSSRQLTNPRQSVSPSSAPIRSRVDLAGRWLRSRRR